MSGHEEAEAAHLLAAQSRAAEAPNDSRAGTQPPGSAAVDAAVATTTEAPCEAPAEAPGESPADARADSSFDLRPPPLDAGPVAGARAAPLEPPMAAPPQAAVAPGLQPQPRPRPRPRPRTSDGGRLTASSPSAQLKAQLADEP